MDDGRYFSKTTGKNVHFKHLEKVEWGTDTRFSSLNVDFGWHEKGAKVIGVREVNRDALLGHLLDTIGSMFRLSTTQVEIMRFIYEHRRLWDIIQYTEDLEIEMAKKIKVSRVMISVCFKTLQRKKGLMEVLKRGKEYRVLWEKLPNPIEVQKCEFVMIGLKYRVKKTGGKIVEGEEAQD